MGKRGRDVERVGEREGEIGTRGAGDGSREEEEEAGEGVVEVEGEAGGGGGGRSSMPLEGETPSMRSFLRTM